MGVPLEKFERFLFVHEKFINSSLRSHIAASKYRTSSDNI